MPTSRWSRGTHVNRTRLVPGKSRPHHLGANVPRFRALVPVSPGPLCWWGVGGFEPLALATGLQPACGSHPPSHPRNDESRLGSLRAALFRAIALLRMPPYVCPTSGLIDQLPKVGYALGVWRSLERRTHAIAAAECSSDSIDVAAAERVITMPPYDLLTSRASKKTVSFTSTNDERPPIPRGTGGLGRSLRSRAVKDRRGHPR